MGGPFARGLMPKQQRRSEADRRRGTVPLATSPGPQWRANDSCCVRRGSKAQPQWEDAPTSWPSQEGEQTGSLHNAGATLNCLGKPPSVHLWRTNPTSHSHLYVSVWKRSRGRAGDWRRDWCESVRGFWAGNTGLSPYILPPKIPGVERAKALSFEMQ